MTRTYTVAAMLKIASMLLPCAVLPLTARATERPLPEIAGITAADPFPNGCVDCHIDRPTERMDVRISTLLKRWHEQIDAKVLARVRTIAGDGVELTGHHPQLPAQSYEDIPRSCMQCHSGALRDVPALGPMLHVLHLSGGRENHFLTRFGGACTYCHKFDNDTGAWSVPSSPEQ